MHRTITIPAPIVRHLRRGLLHQLGAAAAQIDQATLNYQPERHPDRLTEPLENLDAHRALLDHIDWAQPTTQHAIPVEDDTHLWALTDALNARLQIEEDYLTSNPPPKQQLRARRNIHQITRFIKATWHPANTPRTHTARRWAHGCLDTLSTLTELAGDTIHRHPRHDPQRETPLPPETDRHQRIVMDVLLEQPGNTPCPIRQLAQHVGGEHHAQQAIDQLRELGLVHTIADHATPTLAARAYHQLHY